MNRIAYTALVAFLSILATLLAVGWLAPDRPAPDEPATDGSATPAAPEAPQAEEAGALPLVTLEELARHDGAQSCWKAIDGKVYDVTDFLDAHPTPVSVMLEWCGRESTGAWETKGYGRPHSEAAELMLEDFLVGRLAPSP